MTSTEVVSNSMQQLKFMYAKFLSIQFSATIHTQDIVLEDGKLVVQC